MNVLITGGSGFIGTNLVDSYVQTGDHVVNVDIAAPRNHDHIKYWTRLDIRDAVSLRKIVKDFSPHILFHMAARTDLDGTSLEDYSANTDGVRTIIEAVRGVSELRHAIFASSMLVCALGHSPKSEEDYCPTTRYGESKVIGERLVRESVCGSFPWTIVRPTSLWGPWFGVPYKNFFDAVGKGVYMHPKGRNICRSYGFVLNTIHQLRRIASYGAGDPVDGRTLYLADYEPIELLRWARTISAKFGVPPPREVPLMLLKCMASVGDVLKRTGVSNNPPLTSFRLNNLLTDAIFDLQELERVAGATPYNMEQGVAITVEWMRADARKPSPICSAA